jgi:hypothetical protein
MIANFRRVLDVVCFLVADFTGICSLNINVSEHFVPLRKAKNQLDVTPDVYSAFLAQHVSGINMPIIRSTI